MGAARKIDPRPQERRRHARVRVSLSGRFMLENKQEFDCETVDMSPGGVLLASPVKGVVTEKVVAYLDHIGRIEGIIVRTTLDGFALKLTMASAKRDRIADLLTWLASREAIGMIEDRRHERIVPRHPETKMKLVSGATIPARIIDISVSGAGVAVKDRPPLGTRISIGRMPGKIVRHFEDGVAVEFLRLVPGETFDEDIVL